MSDNPAENSLTLTELQRTLPLDWDGQRRALNFGAAATDRH
jgi:hypothetical protein